MEKFAKKQRLRPAAMVCALALLCGCAAQTSGYIKADHPYARKLYGDYDKIIMVVKEVLQRNGWSVLEENHPSVYERAAAPDMETPKDLLIFTDVKRHFRLFYSTYSRLNVFCRATAEGAEVEIRYAKVTPLGFKQFQSIRNDKLADHLLAQMDQELLETK